MPLVSVIIPVYNAQRCLPSCLESVLRQGFRDYEIILINDGSKDESLALCRAFADEDDRIRVIDQPNGGPGAARNAGLKIASGEYLLFIDSDDMLKEGAMQALVDGIAGHDVCIAHFQLCTGDKFSNRGLIKEHLSLDREDFLNTLIKWPGSYYYSALWNKLYSARIVREQGLRFDESIIWGEDCLFNMYYYHHVQKVCYIPVVVYSYYRKVTGLSWGSVFRLHKGMRIKRSIYLALRSLYVSSGLYRKHFWRVQRYIFNVTLMD